MDHNKEVKFKRGNKVSIHWGREWHGYDSQGGWDIPSHGLVECLGRIKPSLYLFYKYHCFSEDWFLYDSKHNIMFFNVGFRIIDNNTGYEVHLSLVDSDNHNNIKVPKSKVVKFLKTHSWKLSCENTDCWFKPNIELSSEANKNSCYVPEEGSEYNFIGPHTNYACNPFHYPEPIETPFNKVDLQDDEFKAKMQAKFDRQKELYNHYKESQKRQNSASREPHISDTALKLAKYGGRNGVIAALGIATF